MSTAAAVKGYHEHSSGIERLSWAPLLPWKVIMSTVAVLKGYHKHSSCNERLSSAQQLQWKVIMSAAAVLKGYLEYSGSSERSSWAQQLQCYVIISRTWHVWLTRLSDCHELEARNQTNSAELSMFFGTVDRINVKGDTSWLIILLYYQHTK